LEKLNTLYNSIESGNGEKSRLSVVLSTDSLYFFVHAGDTKGAIFQTDCNDSDEKCNLISNMAEEYQTDVIHLYYHNSLFSLVPRNLFLYGYEKDYVRNIFNSTNQDVLFHDQLLELSAVNIYAFSLQEDLKLRQRFSGIKTHHFVSQLINGKITLASFGETKSSEDVLYQVNNIKESKFEFDRIELSGVAGNLIETELLLAKYFSSVSIKESDIWANSQFVF